MLLAWKYHIVSVSIKHVLEKKILVTQRILTRLNLYYYIIFALASVSLLIIIILNSIFDNPVKIYRLHHAASAIVGLFTLVAGISFILSYLNLLSTAKSVDN